jgi:hypothetical protein
MFAINPRKRKIRKNEERERKGEKGRKREGKKRKDNKRKREERLCVAPPWIYLVVLSFAAT